MSSTKVVGCAGGLGGDRFVGVEAARRRMPLRCVTVALLSAGVLCVAPAQAVEVPLSRASSDRAIAEGGTCERLADAGSYVAASGSTSGLMGAMIESLMQHYLSDATTQSFVTVRLTTPYTLARRAACEAHLLGGDFDVESLWNRLQAVSVVRIRVETTATYEGNTIVTRDAQGEYSPPYSTHPVAGPRVERAGLRRGQDANAITLQPVAGGGGVDYEFPATALQGKGPFYTVIHTTVPDTDMAVKLKRSIVRLP